VINADFKADFGKSGMSARKARILIAKPGLDGHDRGAKVVARGLADAGYEVIYTGLHQTPEQIAEAAVQEDVDAVGLSILSGAHMTLFPRVLELLEEKGAKDIMVFGGGIIPPDDIEALSGRGVAGIFTPGTLIATIVSFLDERLAGKEREDAFSG
jgi:methylmalonyl-CoA mutase C-terminal domain/subunit